MKKVLFEDDGIIVYVEDGTIYEADDANTYTFPDTEENREKAVADAKATVREWKGDYVHGYLFSHIFSLLTIARSKYRFSKYMFCGYTEDGDHLLRYADNEDDIRSIMNEIDEIGEVILVNKQGQLLWSRAEGLNPTMRVPKYFHKYFG